MKQNPNRVPQIIGLLRKGLKQRSGILECPHIQAVATPEIKHMEKTFEYPLDALRALAAAGDPEAQIELGNSYWLDDDHATANYWWWRAKGSNTDAADIPRLPRDMPGNNIERHPLRVAGLVGMDKEQAINWFNKAKEQRQAYAARNLKL